MQRLTVSFATFAFTSAAFAASAPTFDPKHLSDDVKTLSSDAFEGRGPATPAETKTVEYVVSQMKAAGLSPGGDLKNGQREWTQDVPLLRADPGSRYATLLEAERRVRTAAWSEETWRRLRVVSGRVGEEPL